MLQMRLTPKERGLRFTNPFVVQDKLAGAAIICVTHTKGDPLRNSPSGSFWTLDENIGLNNRTFLSQNVAKNPANIF